MLTLKATESALDRFAEQVVGKSKSNLKRAKKKASGGLIDSINSDLKVHKNSFSLSFEMEDYWEFVDYGVKGVGGKKADGTGWKKKRVTNSKFKYKKKKPPIMAFNGWTIRKGIAPRSKGGQFTKRRGLLFAIATSVFHTGLETTSFFTRPFEKEYRELPDELIEAYALDMDNLLEQVVL